MAEVTAAVERAGLAIKETVCTAWPAYVSDRMAVRIARDGLAAALDVEEMARVLNGHAPAPADDLDARTGLCNGCSCGRMDPRENRSAHVAGALRDAILGEA